MKNILAFIFLNFSFTFLPHAYGQWTIDAETGLAFPAYNDVRIFNESGTLFEFNEELEIQGPVIPVRVRVGYTFNERTISLYFGHLYRLIMKEISLGLFNFRTHNLLRVILSKEPIDSTATG